MNGNDSQQAEMYANSQDKARSSNSTSLKRKKSSRREERELLQDFYEQDEDFLYGPGLAD